MDDSNVSATRDEIQQPRTGMNHHYNDLVKRISDFETKLLQAFYTYAESNQKRLAAIELESAGLTGVEKRLNMPPQQ